MISSLISLWTDWRKLIRRIGRGHTVAKRQDVRSLTSSCPIWRPMWGFTLEKGHLSVHTQAVLLTLPGIYWSYDLTSNFNLSILIGVMSYHAIREFTQDWKSLCVDFVAKLSWDQTTWTSMKADMQTWDPDWVWKCCKTT